MFHMLGHRLKLLAAPYVNQSSEEQHIMDKGVTNIVIVVLIVACVFIYILWKNSRRTKDAILLIAQQQGLVGHDERARIFCRAIHMLNPNLTAGVDYIIRHDSPEQEPYIAEWMADTPQPTNKDIKSALLEISDVHHEENYATMRRMEYPSVGEQLDAAYQARQGNHSKQNEIDEEIRSVREKYPKTDECV
jgi:hypothetical protein